jgi:glycosyltransferase involved in cell wall biosynthesis
MTADRLRWLLMATHVPADGAGGGMVRYAVEMAAALGKHPDVELGVLAGVDSRPFFTSLLGDPAWVLAAPRLPVAARSWVERDGMGIPALRHGWDVVHGTKHLVPRRSRAHRVLTVHDMLALDRRRDFSVVKRRLLPGPYLRSIDDAATVVCVSEATRDRLCSYVPSARARAVVVPSAVSSAVTDASPRPVEALMDVPFALVVGDASRRKNLTFIIGLWSQVRAQVPAATLVTVGPSGWGRTSRGAAFDALTRECAVMNLHHVDDGTLRWCYERAAAVMCPSLLEGFGLPAVEALAFGAPLVTSDDAALCEVTAGRATHVPADDERAWVDAIVALLRRQRTRCPSPAVRRWSDVADETVTAVRRAS